MSIFELHCSQKKSKCFHVPLFPKTPGRPSVLRSTEHGIEDGIPGGGSSDFVNDTNKIYNGRDQEQTKDTMALKM